MIERQLRWNRRKSADVTGNDRNLLEYFVLIVNDQRAINTIESKIFEQLAHIIDLSEITSKSLPDTHGIRYKYIEFKSERSEFNPRKAYDGKIIKDSNLYPRQKDGMLEEYIIKTIGAQ